MKTIDGMNYRNWQKRNSNRFFSFSKKEQKQLREKGYYNIGWVNVRKSWQLLNNNVVSMFDIRLQKGDLTGAIDVSVLESQKVKTLACESINNLMVLKEDLDKKINQTLSKYPLL
ncbi:hypothetical protein [Crocosphaera chwakensis]|uniref:Uncharacterized protein n=1 Tax=Crocosphaera chwakensis CCY0110 TaxID=391612 RepID=A3IZ68_9CHRO|nr:hypothetical protein [Crocosphaera chwakensis]EAZ88238.1 hypothetical protein CY0110_01280 [Crocosphaera chwakensis CCY0110]